MEPTYRQTAAIAIQLTWWVLPLLSSTFVRAADAAPATDRSTYAQEIAVSGTPDDSYRLAQADQATPLPEEDKEESKKQAEQLEEVVVTGTHIRTTDAGAPSPEHCGSVPKDDEARRNSGHTTPG